MRILVVDDNKLIRKMVRAVLEEEGMECEEAADMSSALAALKRSAFDLCLLDQNLPDGEGLAVLRAMAAWRLDVRPRVVLLTGSDEEGFLEKARALGASGVLLKPVNPDHLLHAVRER